MDRKVNTLAPAAGGWRFHTPGTGWSEVLPWPEAVAALPPTGPVELAVPTRLVVLERMRLPASDPTELEGMVALQLEKTLPWPVEETVHHPLLISSQAEPPESDLAACAIHRSALEALCEPLAGRLPRHVTLQALHTARQAPPQEAACALWLEEEALVFGVFENGAPTFLELLPGVDLPRETTQALLSADLAGAATQFTTTLLDPALAPHASALSKATGAPTQPLRPDAEPPAPEGPDFALEKWHEAAARQARFQQLRRRAAQVGVGYLVLLVLGFGYIGLQKQRATRLEAKLAELRPTADAALARQARWRTLEPAIDRGHFTVELLHQVAASLPSKEIRITLFEHAPGQLRIEGEAPNASEAVAFAEALKKNSALSAFRFEAGPPTLLPNERAQFRIYGKP